MKRFAVGSVLLLAVALAGWQWSGSNEPTYPITNEKPSGSRIIAFGDSLTAGVGGGGQGYVEQLSQRLGVTIINKGVSGDTTHGALQRLDADVLRQDPRIVLLCLGGNDFLQRRDRDIAFGNLEQIVRRIQERGALVILIGMDFPLGGSWATQYQALAVRMGCPFVPRVMDGILGHDALMADTIHPNSEGYKVFADRIDPVLRKYLQPN